METVRTFGIHNDFPPKVSHWKKYGHAGTLQDFDARRIQESPTAAAAIAVTENDGDTSGPVVSVIKGSIGLFRAFLDEKFPRWQQQIDI